MKKKVLLSLALATLLSCGSLSAFSTQNASADELRYHYPDIETCATYTTEITCTSILDDYTTTEHGIPLYYATGDLTNACGAVGGAVVVGYYDRFYPDLIANWTPYYSNGTYKRADTTYVPAVMQELYTLMRTNVDDVGVSQTDCRNGLQTYFINKDRTLTYSSVETNSVFDYNLYKQSIAANKPVLMFCLDVTISTVSHSPTYNKATWSNQPISGGHIVVGFGYTTVNYYNGDTLIGSDECLLVSSGRSNMDLAYININSTSWLVDGYSVTVS